jgi:predicted nucleotidyltransferase
MTADPGAVTDALRASGASFALVFGSRARGDERADSDLDIGASWPDDPPAPWRVVVPDGVDLVVLNAAPLELAGRIALEGVVLFDDDPPARVRWVADTRKVWLDERPRFERAHREFVESAIRGRSTSAHRTPTPTPFGSSDPAA